MATLLIKDDSKLYAIAILLENTGYWLQQDPYKNAKMLWSMQERIGELAKNSSELQVIFLNNFLDKYIKTLGCDFVQYFTHEEGSQQRDVLEGLLLNIGDSLVKIADSLLNSDFEEYTRLLARLLTTYQERVREKRDVDSRKIVPIPPAKWKREKYPAF